MLGVLKEDQGPPLGQGVKGHQDPQGPAWWQKGNQQGLLEKVNLAQPPSPNLSALPPPTRQGQGVPSRAVFLPEPLSASGTPAVLSLSFESSPSLATSSSGPGLLGGEKERVTDLSQ